MIFALASALRLARFNAALDDDKPKWQSNYFMGVPTPAAAIAVLLPLYLDQLGFGDAKAQWALKIVLVYTVFIAFMMVSNIPTYSGKLLGERVGREWVLPIFVLAIGVVSFLFTYPYETLTMLSVLYLGFIPVSWRAFRDKSEKGEVVLSPAGPTPPNEHSSDGSDDDSEDPKSTGRVFAFRPTDPGK